MSMPQAATGTYSATQAQIRNRAVRLQQAADGWAIGLFVRLVFAATLLVYYLNSAVTKLGDGLLGLFPPSAGAFAQILPPIAEQYSYDVGAIPFFPWHLVVIAGTVAEFALPVLIVAGLLTRFAALAMIGFVFVQTLVDIVLHGAVAGTLFDNQASDLIDIRLLWVALLAVLVLKGAGSFSLDRFLLKPVR